MLTLISFVNSNLTLDMDANSRKAQLLCDKKKLDESFPKIIDQVTSTSSCEENKDAIEHYRKVCV